MCGCPRAPPTGDLPCNPGRCPDWESNQQPFSSQAGTQYTEPHQPGCLSQVLLSQIPSFIPFCDILELDVSQWSVPLIFSFHSIDASYMISPALAAPSVIHTH